MSETDNINAFFDKMAERDPTKPNTEQGLYRKFNVERVDGSVRHQDCEYFVLDVSHDPHAMAALAAYAAAVEPTHPLLADDLRKKYELPTVALPPAKDLEADYENADVYCTGHHDGWNDCRRATIARMSGIATAINNAVWQGYNLRDALKHLDKLRTAEAPELLLEQGMNRMERHARAVACTIEALKE